MTKCQAHSLKVAGLNPAPATNIHFSRTFRGPFRSPAKFAVLYYLMFGTIGMIAKDNVTIGIEWRFGPDWPGQQCGAKTRRGTECQRPANKRNGRCRLHGGRSTGPKSAEGRAKIAAANLRHGEFTQAKIAKYKEDAKVAKRLRDRLRLAEQNLRRHGIID